MQVSTVFALAGLVASAAAQALSLPTCAQTCADQYLQAGIGSCGIDPKCICSNSSFLSSIACCIAPVCSADEQAQAVAYAQQLCTANGVSVPSAVVCASTASGTQSTPTSTATGSAASAGATDTASATSASNGTVTTPTATSTTGAAATAASTTAPASTGYGLRLSVAPALCAVGAVLAAAVML